MPRRHLQGAAGHDRPDPVACLRAGLAGLPLPASSPPPSQPGARALQAPPQGAGGGPIERITIATARLPGLRDGRLAHANGRVLRAIARLLDRAGAPAMVGHQLLGNLAAACLAHSMRPGGGPWVPGFTIDLFVELYTRVLDPPPAEIATLRERLLAEAG